MFHLSWNRRAKTNIGVESFPQIKWMEYTEHCNHVFFVPRFLSLRVRNFYHAISHTISNLVFSIHKTFRSDKNYIIEVVWEMKSQREMTLGKHVSIAFCWQFRFYFTYYIFSVRQTSYRIYAISRLFRYS